MITRKYAGFQWFPSCEKIDFGFMADDAIPNGAVVSANHFLSLFPHVMACDEILQRFLHPPVDYP